MFNAVSEKLIDIFEAIVQWMYESFVEPFTNLPTLKNLVFGRVENEEFVWGTFRATDLTEALNPLFYTMATLSGFFIIAFIVIYGIRISGGPLNPHRRNESIELIKDLLMVGIVLVNLPTLYDLLFSINQAVVGVFDGAYESNLDNLKESRNEEISGVIGLIFIQLVLLGLMIWANFYYLMRKITLIILMGLGPLMLAFWLHPQFKPITASWFKELVGSVFIQSIHAFVFWTVATISATTSGFIETVIVYIIFIPISESIRKLFLMGGDMQGGLAKAGSMLGMGALAGMYGSVKGAVGDKSVTGAIREGYSGFRNQQKGKGGSGDASTENEGKNTLAANPGSDSGTTPQAEKMLRAGDIFSRGGKAVFGMAGAVAGSPLGPIGAIIGATGASTAGGAVGGVTGRVGSSAIQGIAARNKLGSDAFKAGGIGKNSDGFQENYANEIADREAASWADENKASMMSNLRERFPDATDKELESHFDKVKADKRAGFYSDAKSKFASVSSQDGNRVGGNQLVASSSEAMANQWASENQAKFFDEYDKSNPQQVGESDNAYATRRMNAFQGKKRQMRNAFAEKGNQVVSDIATDGLEPIDRDQFNDKLGSAIQDLAGVGNAQKLTVASKQAISHVQGENILQSNGKPNAMYLASRMANLKTKDMEDQFLTKQRATGVSDSVASQMWNERMPGVHRDNLNMYKQSAHSADSKAFSSGFSGVTQRMADVGVRAGDYLAASTGVRGMIAGTKTLNSALQTGIKETGASLAVNTNFGQGGIVSHIKGFKQATTDGIRGTATAIAEKNGGVIETQRNLQNATGYGVGMVFGAKGYQIGKTAMARFSPLKQPVQEAIHTPSEVIQMAQTVTDDHGNHQIAPGAIRQVTTPTESYVEVRTKSGETQVVSQKGAGHSGLRQGDVIYQDLDVQEDSLVVSTPKGGGSSTYRMDSGGGKVPSSIPINANPNELLGSPRISTQHRPDKRMQLPSFSQSVDSGQFYVEDLQSHGMKNVQVVVEKDRQFVTAQNEGVTYRVSPIYAGDTKLSGSESINIPVNIQNNQLKPATPVPNSNVAVNSQVTEVDGGGYSAYPTNPVTPYYSSKTVNSLMTSKAALRAQRGLEKRQQLDEVRRKQGLLG